MEKFFENLSKRSVLVFMAIFVISLVLGALLFFGLNAKIAGLDWTTVSQSSLSKIFGTEDAGGAGGFLQGVWGTAGSLAASFVAIVLAQQALVLARKQNDDQDAQGRREQEQMRFNVRRDISEELSPMFDSVAAFDEAIDLAYRRSGELAKNMMVSMGIAAHDYLRLTSDPIVKSSGDQYKLHDHAVLMAQYVRREEFEERLGQVKSAIGKMADALNRLRENGMAATAYSLSACSGQSSRALGGPVAPSDLAGVVSLLRNKAESHISGDQLVRMWFLALAPDRVRAEDMNAFNEKFILQYEFLEHAVSTDRQIAERSWALLGSLISTLQKNPDGKEFTNFGLELLNDVCHRLPCKQSIRSVYENIFADEPNLSNSYSKEIDRWPYLPKNRKDLSNAVTEHAKIRSGDGQGPRWDNFRELAWQLAAARIGSDEVLTLQRSRRFIFENKMIHRRDDLCQAASSYFKSAQFLFRIPVAEVHSAEVKFKFFQTLPLEASKILEDLIHSPWFRGGLEVRRSALNAAEDFFSWLILYGDDPNYASQLSKIDSCRSSLKDDSRALEVNVVARLVLVDQAFSSQSVVQRRLASNEPFESILRSFLSLIENIERLADLDGKLILLDDVIKLCNALNNLTQHQGFDERCLCAEVVPRLKAWKGNCQLLNKETEEFIDALDNGCMAALF